MAGAGPARRVGQGRVQPGPAGDRVPLRRRGDHLRQPLDLQDRGQGDRRPGRHEHHVHGQAERPGGQLLPHPPLGPRRRTARRCMAGDGPHGLSAVRRALHRRAAGRAVRADACATRRTSTPTSGTCRAASRPTAIRWGVDNRTCALRLVGHGAVAAGGEPGAGRRREPLPRGRGDDRGRAVRHGPGTAAGARASTGNAYTDPGPPGAGHAARRAGVCGRKSELAREAFGSEVVEHYANAARVEIAAFDAAVTDWELHRSFERHVSAPDAGGQVQRPGSTGWSDHCHVRVHGAEPGHRGTGRHGAADHARSRPTRRSPAPPRRCRAGGRSRPATGPRCCAGSPTRWTRTSRSWPRWRWPAPGTRSARPAGRRATSGTCCATTRRRRSGCSASRSRCPAGST